MTPRRFLQSFGKSLAVAGRSALAIVVPRVCFACHAMLDDGNICSPCRRELVPSITTFCWRCGETALRVDQSTCLRCGNLELAFEQVVALGHYRGRLRDLILESKRDLFGTVALVLGAWLAEERAATLEAMAFDAIVPMPMFWSRRLWRGVNGPEWIASAVAEHTRRPVFRRLLRRCRSTPTQVGKTAAERAMNVANAFAVRTQSISAMRGKTLLLVDDVMTTGASCSEAARTLRAAGAERVVVAVVARAELNTRRETMKKDDIERPHQQP